LRDQNKLTNEDIYAVAYGLMNQYQQAKFETTNEIDFAHSIQGVARFRVNCFKQRGSYGMVFRVVPTDPPSLDDLNLPEVLKKIALERKGLILVTGTTGSGKSTTLAAMVNHINTNRNCHVITIEDPIEFLHRDRKSIINQREVGSDTNSFASALRAALRQDPDVILVGEMRDRETIDIALTAAETGHLVLSTLHTLDAKETIMRIVSQYPPHQHLQIRLQLAGVLKAAVSQRLLPKIDGQGVMPACEVLVSTRARPRVYHRREPHVRHRRRHSRRHGDLRHADLRPVAHGTGQRRQDQLPRGAPQRHEPERFRAAHEGYQGHVGQQVGPVRKGGTGLGWRRPHGHLPGRQVSRSRVTPWPTPLASSPGEAPRATS
jgi:pilus retraction protein PilT